MRFVLNIENGKKMVLRRMLDVIRNDVGSVTGRNLRCIKLKTEEFKLENVNVYKLPYKEVPKGESWRLQLAREILDTKNGDLSTNITKEQTDDLAEYIFGS